MIILRLKHAGFKVKNLRVQLSSLGISGRKFYTYTKWGIRRPTREPPPPFQDK